MINLFPYCYHASRMGRLGDSSSYLVDPFLPVTPQVGDFSHFFSAWQSGEEGEPILIAAASKRVKLLFIVITSKKEEDEQASKLTNQ